MKILVTGATGLVGGALVPLLAAGGHEVVRMGRTAPETGDVRWDPERGVLDAKSLEGFDGVVHLAGENIATGRWTAEKKRRIRDSRVRGTRLLAETLAGLERPPRVLVSTSAVGFYGDRGDEELTEASPAGAGFLSGVCREWETATEAAQGKDIRGRPCAAGRGAEHGRRRSRQDAHALQARGRRHHRQRPAIHELDHPGRHRGRPRPPAGHGHRGRTGERGGRRRR